MFGAWGLELQLALHADRGRKSTIDELIQGAEIEGLEHRLDLGAAGTDVPVVESIVGGLGAWGVSDGRHVVLSFVGLSATRPGAVGG